MPSGYDALLLKASVNGPIERAVVGDPDVVFDLIPRRVFGVALPLESVVGDDTNTVGAKLGVMAVVPVAHLRHRVFVVVVRLVIYDCDELGQRRQCVRWFHVGGKGGGFWYPGATEPGFSP